MRFDLHVHTSRLSLCSRIDPGELGSAAREAGLSGIALTEHDEVWDRVALERLLAPGTDAEGNLVAVPGIVSAVQWNAHSWDEFAVDDEARSFRVERAGSALIGHFMYHHNAFFSLSEGFDPPPAAARDDRQWRSQHHLRFTPAGLVSARNLGVVLCPAHGGLDPAPVRTKRIGNAEVARIGDDLAAVNMGGALSVEGIDSDALAVLRLDGHIYEIRDDGLIMR